MQSAALNQNTISLNVDPGSPKERVGSDLEDLILANELLLSEEISTETADTVWKRRAQTKSTIHTVCFME